MTCLQPEVSIITPVFNGADYIELLIQSFLDQDFGEMEHIVIDDGSSDDGATAAILRKYAHLRWWSRENKGQYATMNEGLMAARGKWVCFISADDVMAPGAVRAVMSFANTHAECDVIYGKTLFINQDGSKYKVQNLFKLVPKRLYGYLPGIYHCAIYLKREKLLQSGLVFDEKMKFAGDFDWIVRVFRSSLRVGRLNKTLAAMRVHPERTSTRSKKAQENEHHALLRKHGYSMLLYRIVSRLLYFRSAALEMADYIRRGDFSALLQRIKRLFQRIWKNKAGV